MLSGSRLAKIKKHGQQCGECGKALEVGDLASWNSFDNVANQYGSKWRCVIRISQETQYRGCWYDRFEAATIQAKLSGATASDVSSGAPSIDAEHSRSDFGLESPSSNGSLDLSADAVQDGSESLPERGPAPSLPSANGSSAANALSVLVDAIAPQLEQRLRSKTDKAEVQGIVDRSLKGFEDTVLDLVETALSSVPTTKIQVVDPNGVKLGNLEGTVHESVPKVVRLFAAGIRNVYLYGSPGAGKTFMADQVGQALGVPVVPIQLSKVSPESALKGFVDANGTKQEQAFIEAIQKPCVVFMDEFDRWGVHLHALLNSVMANGYMVARGYAEPIQRHAQCYILAAGNTTLRGRDEFFPEAQASEFSTIDRLTFVHVAYDEQMETRIAAAMYPQSGPWVSWIQKIRPEALSGKHGKIVATPRASYEACKLFAAGFTATEAADMLVFKGIDPATRDKFIGMYPLPTMGGK
jgi:hypothetical protein